MAHDPKLRARAEALLLAGNTPGYVAKETGLPLGSVKNWDRALKGKVKAKTPAAEKKEDLTPAQIASEHRIGDLVTDLLKENLKTLSELQRMIRNEVWFKRQSAADIAMLCGVTTDKTVRILEAIERSQDAGN